MKVVVLIRPQSSLDRMLTLAQRRWPDRVIEIRHSSF
jgi:hypothetical protein